MKRVGRTYLAGAVVLVLLSAGACKQEPVFPDEPRIEFMRIWPDTVREYEDSIFILFRFQDGDGDLGALSTGDLNLSLIDSRISNGLTEEQATNRFSIPNLTPDTRIQSIQGEITVKMPFTIVLPPLMQQDIRFQIKLWDRAGNLAKPMDGSEQGVFTEYITVIR
jgi:hypothetical protein